MGSSLMLGRAMHPERIRFLVDLGSVNEQASRDCADLIRGAGVGRRNFSIEGNLRLLVMLPPTKADSIIKQCGLLVGSTYWQCTHHRPFTTPLNYGTGEK